MLASLLLHEVKAWVIGATWGDHLLRTMDIIVPFSSKRGKSCTLSQEAVLLQRRLAKEVPAIAGGN